jgi:hypothetical protein
MLPRGEMLERKKKGESKSGKRKKNEGYEPFREIWGIA